MARLHFIFAPHTLHLTPAILEKRLGLLKKKGIIPSFIAVEMSGVKASEKQEVERADNNRLFFKNAGISRDADWREAVTDALAQISIRESLPYDKAGAESEEEFMHKIGPRYHFLGIRFLAYKYGIPIGLAEPARPKQLKKMRKLEGLKEPEMGSFSGSESFAYALNRAKAQYYLHFHQMQARHDEVIRNLRKTIRKYGENSFGIIIYGSGHAGLDKFAERKLGAKVSREKMRGTEQEEYISSVALSDLFEHQLHYLANGHFAKPEDTPSKHGFARLALALLHGTKFGGGHFSFLSPWINALKHDDIERHWGEFQQAETDGKFFGSICRIIGPEKEEALLNNDTKNIVEQARKIRIRRRGN